MFCKSKCSLWFYFNVNLQYFQCKAVFPAPPPGFIPTSDDALFWLAIAGASHSSGSRRESHTDILHQTDIYSIKAALFVGNPEKRSRMGCREVFILLMVAMSTLAVEVRNQQKIAATPNADQCDHQCYKCNIITMLDTPERAETTIQRLDTKHRDDVSFFQKRLNIKR